MSLRAGTVPNGVSGKGGVEGGMRKAYVLVGERTAVFLLFPVVACLRFPTSGTTFSQEPEQITLEVALLYAQHKPGFHGNNSEGGC